MTTNQYALTKDQVRLYHEQGWAGPYTLISEEEMAVVRRRIDEEILEPGRAQGLAERDYFHNRHLDNRCVYELLSHPNLVERAASLLGPHLVLWRTNFQIKAPLSEQERLGYGGAVAPGLRVLSAFAKRDSVGLDRGG